MNEPYRPNTGSAPRAPMQKKAVRRKKSAITREQLLALVIFAAVCVLLLLLLYRALFVRSGGKFEIPALRDPLSGESSGGLLSEDVNSESSDTSDTSDSSNSSNSSNSSGSTDPVEDLTRFQYDAQGFVADLREFEQYMNPEGEAYLFLVNADHPLTADDTPDDLCNVVNTRKDGRDTQKLRLYAEKALEALFLEAEKEGILYSNNGIVLSVTSAYRSYNSQKWIFEDYVQQTMNANPSLSRAEAEAKVIAYSSRPGTSEHQSGLCLDMHNFPAASSSNGMREQFAASKAGQWLLENCAKFGYILRYPEGKSDKMCGVGYESWHFRYVGRYHAMKIMESGLCLEEYMANR